MAVEINEVAKVEFSNGENVKAHIDEDSHLFLSGGGMFVTYKNMNGVDEQRHDKVIDFLDRQMVMIETIKGYIEGKKACL